MSSFRFRREEHLKGRKEIREVFNNGKQFGCKGSKLFVLKNDLPYNRICFTFSKVKNSFWNAVARNRAKRISREAYRLIKNRLCGGADLILLSYPDYLLKQKPCMQEMQKQLEFLFSRAGLIK